MNFNDGKNYSGFDNICSAIKESLPDFDIRNLKPYLWRDEIKDIFMLTKTMEIYLFNRYTLNCHCWSGNTYRKIKSAGLIMDDSGVDDTGIYQFKSSIINLSDLTKLSGEVKQRMSVRSNKRKRWKPGSVTKYANVSSVMEHGRPYNQKTLMVSVLI